jgi:hypothetical protein
MQRQQEGPFFILRQIKAKGGVSARFQDRNVQRLSKEEGT